MTHDFIYAAHVDKVYDGDTITCSIDLGFGIKMNKQKIRLFGINTPEVRGSEREQGLVSRDRLRERILDKDIYETNKPAGDPPAFFIPPDIKVGHSAGMNALAVLNIRVLATTSLTRYRAIKSYSKGRIN